MIHRPANAHLTFPSPRSISHTHLARPKATIATSPPGIAPSTGAGEGAMPGGDVAIVALGRARWVWDIERGEGKVRWALAGRWIIALSRGLSLLRLWRHGVGTLSSRNG